MCFENIEKLWVLFKERKTKSGGTTININSIKKTIKIVHPTDGATANYSKQTSDEKNVDKIGP